jgi:endo-1,4-beta-xylanase
MQQADTMEFAQKQFNSFTLENELKPSMLFSDYSKTVTVEEAKKLGYEIPEDYTESTVAQLDFSTLDKILEIAHQYGLRMRGHTMMWHQQTATKFFKTDYDASGSVVSTDVMNARIKFYIRTVMKHVMEKERELTGEAGSIVYCWDVTNEYIHRTNVPTNPSWTDVYGDMGLQPSYVKLAYEQAYGILKEYGVQDDVTLFYNDYNEYDCTDDIITLVNYINEGEETKICGGIGMQSHITTSEPTLEKYSLAVDKFLATGLQVQVTELDIGLADGATEADQAKCYGDIMSLLVNKQINRDTSVNAKGITGVTVWGLYDSISWRKADKPLLFGTGIDDPKAAFYAVIEAVAG